MRFFLLLSLAYASAYGKFVPESTISQVLSGLALTWFIRYFCVQNTQFLNNLIDYN